MVVIRACVITVLLHLSLAQDCTLLLSTSKKRWLFDGVASAFNNLPDNLKPLLPATTELDNGCRFDLTNINQAQKETLKQLGDKGYTVCVGCGLTNSDHGRCHSIDICSKGSSCISGHNDNKFPTYYFHGCCAESDSRCKSGRMDFKVRANNRDYTVHYTTTVCKGALCNENGYTDQKVALQQFLAGISPSSPVAATTTSIPDVPTTTAAPSGAAVDGGWATWNHWGACDVSCGIGIRQRYRSCISPVPANGGAQCVGESSSSDLCNVNPCT